MGGAAWFIARTQVRRRGKALFALTLVAGVVGGVAMSLVAGGRRSASVVDRYFAAAIPYDLQLYAPTLTAEQIRAIPGVERAHQSAYIGAVYVGPRSGPPGINAMAFEPDSIDPTIRLLAGTFPDRSDPNGVVVNEAFVRGFERGVGDEVTMQTFAVDQLDEVVAGQYDPRGPQYTVHITGIVRTPMDIAADEVEALGTSAQSEANGMFVPSAFYEAHRDEFLDFGAAYDVELVEPGQMDAFGDAVGALTDGEGEAPVLGPPRFGERRDALDSPVGLETTWLLALGIALAVGGLVVVGLLLRIEQRWHDADSATLRAMGSTTRQLGAVAALRALPVAAGAVMISVGLAVALSGRYPVGLGRQLELDPGLDVNRIVLGLGALALVLVVVGLSFVAGASMRVRDETRRRPTIARWLVRAGAPPDVTVGTHFAFERRQGTGSLPTRAVVGGGALALGVVVGIALFVGGIDRLYDRGESRGWPWHAAIGNVNFDLGEDGVRIAGDPRIAAATIAGYGDARIDGASFEVLAVDKAGTAPPQIVAGRMPAAVAEIAMGRRALRALDAEVGDNVQFSLAGSEFDRGAATETIELTIVGVALAPGFGEADLGDVAVVTFDTIAAAGGDAAPRFVLVRVRGDDPTAVLDAIDQDYTQEMLTDITPSRIVNLHRVRLLPVVGMAAAGAMGTVILLYALAAGSRGRTGELAILRALGLPSRRITHVLAWQGVALAGATLAVGIPLGLVVGSFVWRQVAHRLGVDGSPTLTPLLLLVPPGALTLALLCSLGPARRARREAVAAALRVE